MVVKRCCYVFVCDHCPEVIKQNPLLTAVEVQSPPEYGCRIITIYVAGAMNGRCVDMYIKGTYIYHI